MRDVDCKPGSPEAVNQGCLCPVMDNHHGEGMPADPENLYWIASDCPLHGICVPVVKEDFAERIEHAED